MFDFRPSPAISSLLMVMACGNTSLHSEAEAELAYRGLDAAIVRAMDLGFDGFKQADSANIPTQTASGDVSGTLTVAGQVDQGASDNKGMRLSLALENYQDIIDLDEGDDREVSISYTTGTSDDLPALDLQLRDIPSGTLDGTLFGPFTMDGDLQGEVVLDITLTGQLEDDGSGNPQRADGTVSISGTATGPSGGVYPIDLAL